MIKAQCVFVGWQMKGPQLYSYKELNSESSPESADTSPGQLIPLFQPWEALSTVLS